MKESRIGLEGEQNLPAKGEEGRPIIVKKEGKMELLSEQHADFKVRTTKLRKNTNGEKL